MAEKEKLTVIVRKANYDFQIDIKDPKLVKKYEDNQERLRDHIRAHLAEAVSELYLGEALQEEFREMNVKHIREKKELVKGFRQMMKQFPYSSEDMA